MQSHEIAKQVRQRNQLIADRYGARIKVAEVPPGPPVLETLVAEVYGPSKDRRTALARQMRDLLSRPRVSSTSIGTSKTISRSTTSQSTRKKPPSTGSPRTRLHARCRSPPPVTQPVCYIAGLLHQDAEKEDVSLTVRLDRATRSELERIQNLEIGGRNGRQVALRELAHVTKLVKDKSIYHKNLTPVTYVAADIAGEIESPVYEVLKLGPEIDEIQVPEGYQIEQHMRRFRRTPSATR